MLVLTGCLADLVGAGRVGAGSAKGLDLDLVVPNAQKDDLVSHVQEGLEDEPAQGRPRSGGDLVRPRTRPLVKIQDGCDNACAYCIVHRLRGKQRSRPRAEIVAELLSLRAQGCHEVVLTGVHVGTYGREWGESLEGLVEHLLDALGPPGPRPDFRVRLSSIEPWDLSDTFFALWQDPRLCRHLHLPLQSGCDATLARMSRHYSTAQYAAWVEEARAAIPGLAVTTDVIAGLPGETQEEHAASAAFCARMQFARTHVFTYSERPGTPAAEMPGQVPVPERRARAEQLKAIGRESAAAFRRRSLGQTLPVVVEKRRARRAGIEGWWTGLTDNYLRVYLQSSRALGNTLTDVRLCELHAGGVRGELVENGRESTH
jgi:threonylcarbamoyladenosine tRNA methylthiotransferase MtaB